MVDLVDIDMFKVYPDIMRSETLRIQERKTSKFGYLPMMVVTTLGSLNSEIFCESVLSCVKLVVSDLHVCLKVDEIRMLVMIRMNRVFMEYMRAIKHTHRPVTRTLHCRNSKLLMCMYALMEDSTLLTMRMMSRSLR